MKIFFPACLEVGCTVRRDFTKSNTPLHCSVLCCAFLHLSSAFFGVRVSRSLLSSLFFVPQADVVLMS